MAKRRRRHGEAGAAPNRLPHPKGEKSPTRFLKRRNRKLPVDREGIHRRGAADTGVRHRAPVLRKPLGAGWSPGSPASASSTSGLGGLARDCFFCSVFRCTQLGPATRRSANRPPEVRRHCGRPAHPGAQGPNGNRWQTSGVSSRVGRDRAARAYLAPGPRHASVPAAARSWAVRPSWSFNVGSAPRCSNSAATSPWPLAQATISGVSPN